jgi:hypothetical protein
VILVGTARLGQVVAMRGSLRTFALTVWVLVAATSTSWASDPSTGSVEALTLYRGMVHAASGSGVYRWDGSSWNLWHGWMIRRAVADVGVTDGVEDLEERQRTFEEVFEELLPSYGEEAAARAAEELLGYERPTPTLVGLDDEAGFDEGGRVIQALVTHRSFVWACASDGLRRLSDEEATRLKALGTTCLDLVAGGGSLVAVTDRGVFRLVRPGSWRRIAGLLNGDYVGLAIVDGVAFVATGTGVYELADRPIRRSGIVLDGFGRLGDRLLGVVAERVVFIDERGQAEPAGILVNGVFSRASDGTHLVTEEELWRFDGDHLKRVPTLPFDGSVYDVLEYDGLWLASSSGVIAPAALEADEVMASLGVLLDQRQAKHWAERLDQTLHRRGLVGDGRSPVGAQWLPEVSLSFRLGERRGLGILDLDRLADELDVTVDELDLDRLWRHDVGAGPNYRFMAGFTWRPSGASVRTRQNARHSMDIAMFRERRRIAKKHAKMLVAHLKAERTLLLYPPRTVRSAAMRLLSARQRHALIEGLLDQEIP